MPEVWYPVDIYAMGGKAKETKCSDEGVCPQWGKEEVGSIIDNQRHEHDEGEYIELFITALIVEEGWCEKIHSTAEKTGSHERQHKDATGEKEGCDKRPWR